MMSYQVYTDGSTLGNGTENAIGGWGFTVYQNNMRLTYDSGNAKGTTNQRMELTALIEALKLCKNLYAISPIASFNVYTDSAYFINCVNQKWYEKWISNGWINSQKQPVKNQDLWEELIPFFSDGRFTFFKVKGHAGIERNEEVDGLARKASALLKERVEHEDNCN